MQRGKGGGGLQPLSVTVLRLSLYCLYCSVIVSPYCGARCPAEIILENIQYCTSTVRDKVPHADFG